jgi:alkylhydroperoxidase/carboxymuconolactone decarboxylase family protein YurZ
VAPADISGLAMDEHVRHALLVAFGLREPVDDAVELMKSMQRTLEGEPREDASAGPDGRTEAGLDVLRTFAGGDPAEAELRIRERYGQLGDDVVDFALGEVWSDDALDRRTRSLMVVSMLAALGRTAQLRSHVAGALNHGVTPEELVQAMRTVAVYAGFPAALTAHGILNEVFEARGIKLDGRGE